MTREFGPPMEGTAGKKACTSCIVRRGYPRENARAFSHEVLVTALPTTS